VLGLTGTPVGSDGFAIWSQAFLVDGGECLSPSYRFFQTAFGYRKKSWFAPNHFEMAFDKRKMPLLQEKLAAISMSYKLTEVRSLNILSGQVELRLVGEQQNAYRAVIDRVMEQDKQDAVQAENSFVKLRQISSGYLPFEDLEGNPRIVQFPEAQKIEWLEEVLFKQLDDYQYIIFHEFTYSGRLICEKLAKHQRTHAWLYGGTPDRAAVVRQFQSGNAQVLVANTATGGMAVDLHKARYIVYYESPCSPIIRKQSEFRPLAEARGGAPLVIDDLVCSPVERHILAFHAQGKSLADALTSRPRDLFSKLDDRKK